MNKAEEDNLLLLVLRLNLKKVQSKEVSEEEETKATEALKTLGLSLEDALKKASALLK
ncbi:MAG: hypothetical protein Athens071426_524 [Parcubacteria group bacterium Athens0714_26]|nr:MAG: hypothetical protein Athens071426_524 [Parcubacteria group bacterium Athens0714_26]